MAGKYVSIDTTELRQFVEKLEKAGRGGEFKRELAKYVDSLGVDFLAKAQDFAILRETVDTRNLVSSLEIGKEGNVFISGEDGLRIEVGTNVEYASFVNDGHWLNPKGVDMRWVPGHWTGPPGDKNARFIYEPGAKTGMLLKQKWIEGSHFFDDAVRHMETDVIPKSMEKKMQEWINKYFSDFV